LCFLQSPDKLQLLKEVREASGQYLGLDDAKKLADLKVENDDVVAMTYMKEGEQQRQQQLAMQHAFVSLQRYDWA
jgi:ribosomal protein L7/L12